MLLQSHQGFIHLLPALPSVWANGSVTGLRAEGDFTFTMEWNAGRLTQCAVTSGHGGMSDILPCCPLVESQK